MPKAVRCRPRAALLEHWHRAARAKTQAQKKARSFRTGPEGGHKKMANPEGLARLSLHKFIDVDAIRLARAQQKQRQLRRGIKVN